MNPTPPLHPAHPPDSLYERDILLWVKDTVAKLKTKDFEHLDLDN